MAQNYNDLEIFHISYNFVLMLYPYLDKFPESEHKNLVLQMKRSAVSIPMNIAEGSSRRSHREFLAFLTCRNYHSEHAQNSINHLFPY